MIGVEGNPAAIFQLCSVNLGGFEGDAALKSGFGRWCEYQELPICASLQGLRHRHCRLPFHRHSNHHDVLKPDLLAPNLDGIISLLIRQRFNLLRHPENLTDKNSSKLNKLLAANEALNTLYVLKYQCRIVWTYQKQVWPRRHRKGWIEMVRESAIEPLMRFANGIERDIEQIVSWWKHRITNGRMEGFNSIINRVLLKDRGIHFIDHLFLKLRQESLL